jgi:hypothetical protein
LTFEVLCIVLFTKNLLVAIGSTNINVPNVLKICIKKRKCNDAFLYTKRRLLLILCTLTAHIYKFKKSWEHCALLLLLFYAPRGFTWDSLWLLHMTILYARLTSFDSQEKDISSTTSFYHKVGKFHCRQRRGYVFKLIRLKIRYAEIFIS